VQDQQNESNSRLVASDPDQSPSRRTPRKSADVVLLFFTSRETCAPASNVTDPGPSAYQHDPDFDQTSTSSPLTRNTPGKHPSSPPASRAIARIGRPAASVGSRRCKTLRSPDVSGWSSQNESAYLGRRVLIDGNSSTCVTKSSGGCPQWGQTRADSHWPASNSSMAIPANRATFSASVGVTGVTARLPVASFRRSYVSLPLQQTSVQRPGADLKVLKCPEKDPVPPAPPSQSH
jgi:hypothetical protein